MWSLVVVILARTERGTNGSQKREKGKEYEVAQEGQEAGSYQAPCYHGGVQKVAKHEQRSTVLRAHKARFSALWPADRQVPYPQIWRIRVRRHPRWAASY